MWGVLFSETIDLLFRPVEACLPDDIPNNFTSCDDYWEDVADEMQERSFEIAIYWACNQRIRMPSKCKKDLLRLQFTGHAYSLVASLALC